jgi:hypothetical protein
MVRTLSFFCTTARTKTQDAESEESGHLVEALGGGHRVVTEGILHRCAGAKAARFWALSTRGYGQPYLRRSEPLVDGASID